MLDLEEIRRGGGDITVNVPEQERIGYRISRDWPSGLDNHFARTSSFPALLYSVVVGKIFRIFKLGFTAFAAFSSRPNRVRHLGIFRVVWAGTRDRQIAVPPSSHYFMRNARLSDAGNRHLCGNEILRTYARFFSTRKRFHRSSSECPYVDCCPGKQSGGNECELSSEHPKLSFDTRKAHAARRNKCEPKVCT